MQLTELAKLWPSPLYKVGGCVRDYLLGLEVKDIDICSTLLPTEVMELCSVYNIPCEVINKSHLVVLINKQWEHTTFRTEINCDGIHADISPTLSLEEDANRRDLTINAIYQEIIYGKLIDPVGGINDLIDGKLRLISSERYGGCIDRLYEHGGRLFRLARFAIKLEGWLVDDETINACKEFAPYTLQYTNAEHFIREWEKANWCWEYLSFLDKVGFLTSHNLRLPKPFKVNNSWEAWYELWKASDKPDLNQFQNQWKFYNVDKDIIKDLELGENLVEDWEWVTTKFKRLSAEEVATHWGKSFIRLNIPTQGDIAKEIGAGPNVIPEWIKQVKELYESTSIQ